MKNNFLSFEEVDGLRVNPRIARLLPRDIAYRYHALPVAGSGDRISVLMSDPEDTEARRAICRFLGPSTCVLHTPADTIDRLLTENWITSLSPPPILFFLSADHNFSSSVETYACSLATSLGTTVYPVASSIAVEEICAEISDKYLRFC